MLHGDDEDRYRRRGGKCAIDDDDEDAGMFHWSAYGCMRLRIDTEKTDAAARLT